MCQQPGSWHETILVDERLGPVRGDFVSGLATFHSHPELPAKLKRSWHETTFSVPLKSLPSC